MSDLSKVIVEDLHKPCSYLTGKQHCCEPARTAVEVPDGPLEARCPEHRGKVKPGLSGTVHTRVTTRTRPDGGLTMIPVMI